MRLKLPSGMTRTVSRSKLKVQKNAPTILFAAGVVGVVATTVSACRATLRVESVLNHHEEEVQKAKARTENVDEEKREVTRVFVATSMDFAKLYAPAIILGSLSIAALTGSHHILKQRNAGLSAALFATERAFAEYRERVVIDQGEDKDLEYRYGCDADAELDGIKKGVKKKPKFNEESVRYGRGSQYARIFDSGNENFCSEPEFSMAFLRGQQNWANDRLRSKGHMFLNDVYDLLGMDRTPAGSQVGWIWDPKSAELGIAQGDNFISFGCFENDDMESYLNFVTGRENAILLDFNVDGEIWRNI